MEQTVNQAVDLNLSPSVSAKGKEINHWCESNLGCLSQGNGILEGGGEAT